MILYSLSILLINRRDSEDHAVPKLKNINDRKSKEHKQAVAKENACNNSLYIGAFIACFQLNQAVHAQRQHKNSGKPCRQPEEETGEQGENYPQQFSCTSCANRELFPAIIK